MAFLSSRRISGIVMLINTFLPVFAILIVGMMIRSTASTLGNEACAVTEMLDGVKVDNDGDLQPSFESLFSGSGELKLAAQSRTGKVEPEVEGNGSCGLFEAIETIVVEKLYQDTATGVQTQVRAMQMKASALGTAVDKSISLTLDFSGAGRVGKAFGNKFNDHIAKPLSKPVENGVNAAANRVRALTYAVFNPQMKNMVDDLREANYKRKVVWASLKRIVIAQSEKFQWLFIGLAIWLTISYAFWAWRRLSESLAMMRNQAPVQS